MRYGGGVVGGCVKPLYLNDNAMLSEGYGWGEDLDRRECGIREMTEYMRRPLIFKQRLSRITERGQRLWCKCTLIVFGYEGDPV